MTTTLAPGPGLPHGSVAPGLAMRPLTFFDQPEIAALFERLSGRSRYLRYLAPIPRLTPRALRHLSAVDHDRHEAVGLFDGRRLVGAAHYFRSPDDPTRAEIAVEVADAYHHHGLGSCLVAELARLAQQHGITVFTATALRENRAVFALVQRAGWPTITRFTGAEASFSMVLTPPQELPGADGDRAVVATA